jgi:hypothetical protein
MACVLYVDTSLCSALPETTSQWRVLIVIDTAHKCQTNLQNCATRACGIERMHGSFLGRLCACIAMHSNAFACHAIFWVPA